MQISLRKLNTIRPLEKVFPTHLKNIEKIINGDGVMKKPLIVDKKTGIVLDGSHRYAYLVKSGFSEAPVIEVDYTSEDIRVGRRLSERFLVDEKTISKKECIKRGLSGELFEPRTTRHFFPFRKEDYPTKVDELEYKHFADTNITHLLADVDTNYELLHNQQFIKEINEETDILIQYLAEQQETKDYLEKQVKMMNLRTGFFPGKFNPPHFGHYATIDKIRKVCPNLIIGVSGEDVGGMKQSKVIEILEKAFPDLVVIPIKGRLIDMKLPLDFGDIDVLFSGNKDVLKWAKKMKINTEHVERFGDFSSRRMR